MNYRLNLGNIKLPETWSDETIYIFKAPEEEGYNVVVNQNIVPHGIDGEDFLKEQYLLLNEHLTDYHETSKEKPKSNDPVQIVEYDWRSPEGKAFQINMMVISDNTLLSFTATSTKEFTAEQKVVVMGIFKSYQKLKQGGSSK